MLGSGFREFYGSGFRVQSYELRGFRVGAGGCGPLT